MGKRVKITKTVVDNLPIDSLVWDSECTGLDVRRQKSDARVYGVFYRTKDGSPALLHVLPPVRNRPSAFSVTKPESEASG
jgi:hypothetical protein